MSGNPRRSRGQRPRAESSWEHVAGWYDGWVGQHGSVYHQQLAIPLALELLALAPGEKILDVGAGQGVLAPYLIDRAAVYTGVDASPRLIDLARQRHRRDAGFLVGDARRLETVRGLTPHTFDAAVFLFSIQDINRLDLVVASLDWVLRSQARVVVVMTHPAFHQPRHSGWGYDQDRKLAYRRIDSYLTPMSVPLDPVRGAAQTWSHHRPISDYVNGLATIGLRVDRLLEVPDVRSDNRPRRRQDALSNADIPLLLGIRASR